MPFGTAFACIFCRLSVDVDFKPTFLLLFVYLFGCIFRSRFTPAKRTKCRHGPRSRVECTRSRIHNHKNIFSASVLYEYIERWRHFDHQFRALQMLIDTRPHLYDQAYHRCSHEMNERIKYSSQPPRPPDPSKTENSKAKPTRPAPPIYRTSFHLNGETRTLGTHENNKICQWYCCSCGQCYGSILYKTTEELKPRESIDNHLLESLKYYSQLAYNNTRYHEPNYTLKRKNTSETASESKKRPSNLPLQAPRKKKALSPGDLTIVRHDTSFFPHALETYSDDEDAESSPDTEAEEHVLLETPTRFTCHRCNHMMCPYCPKVRVKDLASTKS